MTPCELLKKKKEKKGKYDTHMNNEINYNWHILSLILEIGDFNTTELLKSETLPHKIFQGLVLILYRI